VQCRADAKTMIIFNKHAGKQAIKKVIKDVQNEYAIIKNDV
jgi:diacylglycerol kinase family enzyme